MLLRPALAVVLLAAPLAASAIDGVREINQICALQTGCFPGDAPGFPVTLSGAGSYRMTGNLTFSAALGPPSEDFIEITGDRIALDMNGFEIRCSFPFSGAPCASGFPAGIEIIGSYVRIGNGFVTGMPGTGIRGVGNDVVVERVHASENGGNGISLLGRNSVVRDCLAAGNDSDGIFNGNEAPRDGNLTEGNVARDNGGDGITGAGTIRRNVSTDNTKRGINALAALVEGNTVRLNDGGGISVAGSSLVIDNVVVGNGDVGLRGISSFSYRGNMIDANSGGSVVVDSGAALNTGGNVCNGSLLCP